MCWDPTARSRYIEGRRTRRGAATRRGTSLSLGGILVLLVLSVVFKQDFFALLGNESGLSPGISQTSSGSSFSTSPEEESLVDFVSFVLDDAQQAAILMNAILLKGDS